MLRRREQSTAASVHALFATAAQQHARRCSCPHGSCTSGSCIRQRSVSSAASDSTAMLLRGMHGSFDGTPSSRNSVGRRLTFASSYHGGQENAALLRSSAQRNLSARRHRTAACAAACAAPRASVWHDGTRARGGPQSARAPLATTQRRLPLPQRMDLGQGKLRIVCSSTSATIFAAGRPGFSITA